MVDQSALLREATSGYEGQATTQFKAQRYIDQIFGEGFELAYDLESTDDLIEKHFRDVRPNTAPPPISEFQCRIGLSTFYVPPIAIDVNTQFKSGALSTGALRSQNSPKFNTGNKETLISMTLYFPNFQQIYGAGVEELNKSIHFENASDEEIDSFMSSLRGLVAQFKYAPFLPVRNAYLNQVHNINAVCMKNLSVASVEGFPGVLAVNLQMYKFNHEVYLPMVQDFNSAMHWGRFRTYCGRAMARIDNEKKGLNLWQDGDTIYDSEIRVGETGSALKAPEQILAKYGFDYTDYSESISLAGPKSIDVREFDFYYPFFVPSAISVPELQGLIAEAPKTVEDRSWWDATISFLSFGQTTDTNTDKFTSFDTVRNMKLSNDPGEVGEGYVLDATEFQELMLYLEQTNTTLESMNAAAMERYYTQRLTETGAKGIAAARLRDEVVAGWAYVLYNQYTENVALASMIADDERNRRKINIQEWLVPMQKLNLDKRYVHIQDVNVRIGNKISRMQLQMQDEPTHQHLGGEDTVVSISMIVTGGDPEDMGDIRAGGSAENELIKLRSMFDTVSGVARLSHGHGTLGFLGLSNAMTDLLGLKYVVPLSFDVQTIPNMPHSYMVTVQLVDFDILQQNRELLDPSQQAYLAEQFGKHNPFLRAKQHFSLFSAYPDFPLDVRDENNKVVGYLNPSFYFRTFEVMEDNLIDSEDDEDNLTPVSFTVGMNRDGTSQQLDILDGSRIQIEGNVGNIGDPDNIRSNVTLDPSMTPGSRYQNAYRDGGLGRHVEDMTKDMVQRNKDGNMVRAFPTYMLWLIDEAGHARGIKLFDNFYGLQSVIDMSLVRSEDIMADTLILRLSNLYSNLSTNFQDYLDGDDERSRIVNRFTTQLLRRATGAGGWILDVDSMNLRPGIRVHLRMGYSSDPRRLETVFNGQITEVHQGEIMTVVCQSDAVELGAVVNSTNKKGHSGKIDSSMDNLYLSEPRDLMVSLLSEGANAAKRMIAHATRGEIFSENKYGIKHFGMILYDIPSEEEARKQQLREQALSSLMENHLLAKEESEEGLIASAKESAKGLFRGILQQAVLRTDIATNLASRKDLEIFKRNIYPGNSLGVAQFLGGDLGDIALRTAAGVVENGGVNPDGSFRTDPISGRGTPTDPDIPIYDPYGQVTQEVDEGFNGGSAATRGVTNFLAGPFATPLNVIGGTDTTYGRALYNLQETLGLKHNSSDQDIVPEIAFRAQTYMKTVWDLFKVCAAMMPDYIVAVRPFEDRSTVFYGKPHWMYTSGVIPITKGRELGKLPIVESPDGGLTGTLRLVAEFTEQDITEQLEDVFSRASQYKSQLASGADPNATKVGLNYSGTPSSILNNPIKRNGVSLDAEGRVAMEMHLPLSSNLQRDVANHKQLNSLSEDHRHPYYMDRKGGLRGGESGFSVANQDDTLPGQPGALGYLEDVFDSIEEAALAEQFYINQRWKGSSGTSNGWKRVWLNARILVYNPENNKAVVCTPVEWGPSSSTGRVAGLSPDAFYILGKPHDGSLMYRVMPDDTPLGEVRFGASSATADSADRVLTQGRRGVEDTGPLPARAGDTGYRDEEIVVNFDPLEEGGFTPAEIYPERTEEDASDVWRYLTSDKYMLSDGSEFWELGEPNHRQTLIDIIMRINGVSEERAVKWLFEEDFSNEAAQYDRAVSDPNRATAAADIVRIVVAALGGITQDVGGISQDQADSVDYRNSRAWVLNDNFLRMLWQDPYARGWVVKTADQDAIVDLFINEREFNFDRLETVFRSVYSSTNGDFYELSDPILDYMRNNDERGTDNIGDRITQSNPFTTFMGAVKSIFMNVAGFVTSSIFQMINGVQDAFHGEANSNILNKSLNDSIYYSAGADANGIYDALQYYSDNPFTREYAEPVFEVREPFQRIHHIGSFQHILDNQIIEANTNVATIVTASSNDDQSVTVHFDKNSPIERQVEKTVDSGIFLSEEGFFSRIWNPINTWRDFSASTQGAAVSDNKLAERIAVSHLKESLKDIYQGEIIILGNPEIRPYDLVFIADSYLKIYGFVEVEQVVHHFTPDAGFVTTITPNAVVTAKDPTRFSLMATAAKKQAIHSVRDRLRRSYKIKVDSPSSYTQSRQSAEEEFRRTAADEIVGTTQFIGGPSSVAKSLIPNAAFNLNKIEQLTDQEQVGYDAGDQVAQGLGTLGISFIATQWWEDVRENILDQNACHIHYLNKRGRAMDAGLNFADGVAVGQMATRDLALWGIDIAKSQVTTGVDGDSRINIGDVIPQLQYSEALGVTEASKQVSLFMAETQRNIRELSGRTGDGQATADPSTVEVFLLEVTKVIDADTFEVKALGQMIDGRLDSSRSMPNGRNKIRLAGVDAPEDPYKAVPIDERAALSENSRNLGLRASLYAAEKMPPGTKFAFRTYDANQVDDFGRGRVLGHAFHSYPLTLTAPLDQQSFMLNQAYKIPLVPYDSFLADGQPVTFDYQLILAGFGEVYISDLSQNLPGVEGARE